MSVVNAQSPADFSSAAESVDRAESWAQPSGQTITTAAEFAAMPVETIVRTKGGSVFEYYHPNLGWCMVGQGLDWSHEEMALDYGPAEVVWRPDRQPTAQPTVEQVADAIHASFDLDTPEDGEPCYCDLDALNEAARAVLALLPGRPESVVKAEALRDVADNAEDALSESPHMQWDADWIDYLRDQAQALYRVKQ